MPVIVAFDNNTRTATNINWNMLYLNNFSLPVNKYSNYEYSNYEYSNYKYSNYAAWHTTCFT